MQIVAKPRRNIVERALAVALLLSVFGACSQSHYEGGGRRDDLGDAALGTTATTPDADVSTSQGGGTSTDAAPADCSAGFAGLPCP